MYLVRVLPSPTKQHVIQRVGEPGRPRNPWKVETGGSNPPTLTNIIRDSRRRRSYTRSCRTVTAYHPLGRTSTPWYGEVGLWGADT